jgi:hypothetical protein
LPSHCEYAGDAGEHLLDAREFLFQVFPAGLRQFEDPHWTVSGREAHLRFKPTGLQHPLQGGVQGAFLDLEIIL